jgi:hypothetical protein
MPRLVVTERLVYTFEELSDKAKQKARQWWMQAGGNEWWWTNVLEDAERMASLLGIQIEKQSWKAGGLHSCLPIIYFSLDENSCVFKGVYRIAPDAYEKIDAACGGADQTLLHLAGHLTAMQTMAVLKYGTTWEADIVPISRERALSCDTRLLDFDGTLDDQTYRQADHDFGVVFSDLCQWIKGNLRVEQEWVESDEYIDDCLIANEYEFDEDGSKI